MPLGFGLWVGSWAVGWAAVPLVWGEFLFVGCETFRGRKTSSPLVWVSKLAGEGEQKTSD